MAKYKILFLSIFVSVVFLVGTPNTAKAVDCGAQWTGCNSTIKGTCNGDTQCEETKDAKCLAELTDCEIANAQSSGAGAPTGGSSGKLNLIPTTLGDSAGYDISESSSLTLMILKIVKGFMGLLGIAAVVLVVYAGFLWMTAGGEEEKVKTAKKILVQATIGLAIILMSYAISSFVISSIVGATTGEVSTTVD